MLAQCNFVQVEATVRNQEHNAPAVHATLLPCIAVLTSTCTALCVRLWHRVSPGYSFSGSKLERPILWTDGHPKKTAAVIVVPDFLVLKQQPYGGTLLSKSLRPYRGVLSGWASHDHKDDAKWWSFAGPAPIRP